MLKKCLSGNQLKLLAMIFMTIDHVGLLLFPQLRWMRMVGRLSFPIYAFLIAEGCRHTRSKGRYLLSLLALAALCQVVEAVRGSWYQCVLVGFSLSVVICWLWELAEKNRKFYWWTFLVLAVLGSWFLTDILPLLLPDTNFAIDYGFWGILTPVLVFAGNTKIKRLMGLFIGLCLVAMNNADIQWLSLFALIPLYFYNNTRGKWNIKWLFYFYYPAHLAAIYLIGQIVRY